MRGLCTVPAWELPTCTAPNALSPLRQGDTALDELVLGVGASLAAEAVAGGATQYSKLSAGTFSSAAAASLSWSSRAAAVDPSMSQHILLDSSNDP